MHNSGAAKVLPTHDNLALRLASENGHTAVVLLLIQHGAMMPTEVVHDDDERTRRTSVL
jgi:hypothetical protein